MSDIRKWFIKQHDKSSGNGNTSKLNKPEKPAPVSSEPDKLVQGAQESTNRRKTSKYFSSDKKNPKEETGLDESSLKRKAQTSSLEKNIDVKPPPRKKAHKVEDNDDDFALPTPTKDLHVTPSKKLKTGSGRGATKKPMDVDESDEDDDVEDLKSSKAAGRGRGGRSALGASVSRKSSAPDVNDEDASDEKAGKSLNSGGRGRGRAGPAVPAGGRGRGGGGRGGFMNFGERKDPPHKGEKEIPEGASDCLAGLTFVISGTLDSLEREEAEDLIKRHGGRVTGSVSKKTNFLLCDEDIEGRKSSKAKELGTAFLTEDGLLDMIRKSKKSKTTASVESPKQMDKVLASSKKTTPVSGKKNEVDMAAKSATTKSLIPGTSSVMPKKQTIGLSVVPWTEKYKPKVQSDIIGNQSIVKQLYDWLSRWNEQFLNSGNSNKGKKQNDSGAKKAVLLSGTPGIGKTTSAKLISQMLGFNAVEVNASDSRGKADSKVGKGIGGSTANRMKEVITNMNCTQNQKTVLIMDEVDGMSAGDRGGVADLIASIKISKIPIICICNDRYSQKLKSLVNYCLLLNFRKPTKQQMAKRLLYVAKAEGLEVNEIALEELADRVNGDMRMALNQLQYMSLSMAVINYDDIRHRLQSSGKDEDISPFTAVDKLFGFNGGKLRMDERVDLCMSDPDLVPLIIQENYINYKPSSAGRDENGVKRMNLLARAAESIGDGDIINVQIRRHRHWQLSQASSLSSSIIPAALLHGQRETLEPGERNFNRFGGWLGKNSTMGKNYRLLEDLHVHVLASSDSFMPRSTLRLDYITLLLKQMTDPLRVMSKEEAVQKVVEFMDSYSISMDDFDTIVEISKYQGHPNPLEGIQPAVKAALTKAYNKGSSSRVIRIADLITLPGTRKAPKKKVAAMLEPVEETLVEDNDNSVGENEEDDSSESEDLDETKDPKKRLESDLQSLNSKGIQVEMDIKSPGSSSAKRASSSSSGSGRGSGRGRGRGKGTSEISAEKKSGRGSGAGSKRKR